MEVDTEPSKEPTPVAEEGFKAPMAPLLKPAADAKPETKDDEQPKAKTVLKISRETICCVSNMS